MSGHQQFSFTGRLSEINQAWRLSAILRGNGRVRSLKRRFQFVARALSVWSHLQPMLTAPRGSPLQLALEQRRNLLGAVVWPCVCSSWGTEQRLKHLAAHFAAVGELAPTLVTTANAPIHLLDLDDVVAGLRVLLDQPPWFLREGPLVINLFADDKRIYSLAFSIVSDDCGRLVAYVGALQGGNTEGVLGDYKALTKTLHGLRPRDFLIEMFRMLCRQWGVNRILAVADASRVHRSAYFGNAKLADLQVNYDAIWEDRAGVRHDVDFFLLPLTATHKRLEEVPSNKRAMYRRRYELLDALERRMALPGAGQLMAPTGTSG